MGKTTEDVRQSILPLVKRKYKYGQNNESLDSSPTILVLAAKVDEPALSRFWDEHLKDKSEEQRRKASFKAFHKSLWQTVKREFGSPLTRLTEIVPFLPFSEDEQAVATHKLIRSVWQEIRRL